MRLLGRGTLFVGPLLLLACNSLERRESIPPENVAGLTRAFQARLDALRAEAGFPGAVAAFVTARGNAVVVTTGLADVERTIPMPADARMPAGSVGKTFVGATALALVREGKLSLDAKIETWLGGEPWFRRLPNAGDITLRMLLTHSSGLPDHIRDADFGAALEEHMQTAQDPDWYVTPEQAVGFLLGKPALFPAGKGFSYTDTGFILVGLLIEKVTGHGYYDEVRARFLAPLKLARTVPSDRRAIAGIVPGYLAPDNPLHLPVKTVQDGVLAFNPATEFTGGGLASNPRDLVRWAKSLYEGRALAGPYVDDLVAGVEWAGVPGTTYGLGQIIRESPLGKHYGHSGWFPGYLTRVMYFPRERMAVAIQVNTDVRQDVDALALALAASILDGVRAQ